MRRREFLLTATLAVGACAAQRPKRVPRIGLQLYTVRTLMAQDVAKTLAAVAAAGYVEVETAGTADLSPRQFKAALDAEGLSAPAAHVPINLVAEQPETLLEAAETLGYRHLVVPWLPPEMRNGRGYAQAIDALNRFGEQCSAAGLQAGYHNHDFEFQPLSDGERAFDLMLRECDARLVRFELDLFWAAHAGVNAEGYLAAAPERFPLCHVKDRSAAGDMVDVGDGTINFERAFAAAAFEHYFVEHDRPSDPLSTIRRSIAAVQKMTF